MSLSSFFRAHRTRLLSLWKVMETSNDNAWTGSNIFAHLNDFQPSIAANVLENECSPKNATVIIVPEVNDTDYHVNDETGMKIPITQSTEKNFVLQCQEDMTQDFIDYLKKMSSTHSTSGDSGKFNDFHIV